MAHLTLLEKPISRRIPQRRFARPAYVLAVAALTLVYVAAMLGVSMSTAAVAKAAAIPASGPVAHSSIASGAITLHGTRGSVTPFVGGSAVLAFTRIPWLTTLYFLYAPIIIRP